MINNKDTAKKNILIINDIPGYGKVATSAMLPILSRLGHNVYNLPTALVSNTLDYGEFTILDTTDYMKKTIEIWERLGFSFDCITTGFLASREQSDIIRDFIRSQKKEGLLVITDPIMGDNGKLYNGINEETVETMRSLIKNADIIIPNLTEAQFLTGLYIGERTLKEEQIKEIIDRLRDFGPATVIITSGKEDKTGNNVVWGYNGKKMSYFAIPYQHIEADFPGTGDVFSAILTGDILAGYNLEDAISGTVKIMERIILSERNEAEKNKGVRIEQYLDLLDR